MRTPPNERVASDISEVAEARTSRSEPERRCVLSGEHGSRDALIRLAISPDGLVLPDVFARAPGRGAWLGVNRAELESAMQKGKVKGALARAYKGAPLTIPDDLPQRIEDALRKALLDRLGLEMRAGHLILGSDRIGEHARGGVLELLLHAADASEDGSKKLDQAWRVGRELEGSGERGIRLPLDRNALSVALGRDNVVHLGVGSFKAAERVEQSLSRLLHFAGASADAPETGGTSNRPVGETI